MTCPIAFAQAAEALVGCRFRLHGRRPETGVDCVGLVVAALDACGQRCELPTGYRIRTGEWPDADTWAERNGFEPATQECRTGDVLLVRPGPGQLHVLVVGPDPERMIEAHAGLQRVVRSRAPAAGAIVGHWRPKPSY